MDKVANQPVLKESLGGRILPPQNASIETEEERIAHVSGDIMATAYAVGEKGADLIKADDGRFLMEVDSKA
jgi:hypothetical protein